MQQGVMGLLALLMLGSAWEIGRSEGGSGAPGLSSFSRSSSGSKRAKRSKSAAKTMLAQIKEKSADSDDSKSGLFAAKAGDKNPVKAEGPAKAAAPIKADGAAADVAVALKAASAKSIDALMAEAKATGGGPVGIGDVDAVAASSGTIARQKRPKIRVRMRMSKPRIDDGEIDGKSVYRKIRARKRAFQVCYERELRRNRGLRGKLALQITVGQNGRVAGIFVTNNGLNNAVANCIKGKMRSIRFPKPKAGEATFSYRFILSSSG